MNVRAQDVIGDGVAYDRKDDVAYDRKDGVAYVRTRAYGESIKDWNVE